MATAKGEKCAHPVCSCITTSGKYCSAQCEAMERDAGHRLFVRTHAAAKAKRPSWNVLSDW